ITDSNLLFSARYRVGFSGWNPRRLSQSNIFSDLASRIVLKTAFTKISHLGVPASRTARIKPSKPIMRRTLTDARYIVWMEVVPFAWRRKGCPMVGYSRAAPGASAVDLYRSLLER